MYCSKFKYACKLNELVGYCGSFQFRLKFHACVGENFRSLRAIKLIIRRCNKIWMNILYIVTSSSAIAHKPARLRGNVHGSSIARWKARGRLPIGANWTFFASYDGWGAMSPYLSKFRCLKGGGSLWTQISGGKGRPPPTIFGTSKVESLGYRMVKKNCRKVQPPE